jgi:hypothetical protein
MPRRSTLAVLLLVALWLPATLHCQLENLGIELIACVDQPAEAAPAEETCCADSGCQFLESGGFALAKSKLAVFLPPALPGSDAQGIRPAALPVLAPDPVAPGQDETLPLRRTWQFVRRAALPARAPDVLNA